MTFTDHEAPLITCPTNQTGNTDPSLAHATVVWTDLLVSDNSEQISTTTCDVQSGSQFGIGETEVICQAVDSSGNMATCTFSVNIEGRSNCIILSMIFKCPFIENVVSATCYNCIMLF